LRCEFFAQINCMQKDSGELRTKLEEVVAGRRRTRAAKPNGNGSTLLLPAPALSDASLAPDALAPKGSNGDGRQ
jgi:hypothetical protein